MKRQVMVALGVLLLMFSLFQADPVMVGMCVSLIIFFGFFGFLALGFAEAGAEDARLMSQGKPPKHGPPPFGPNNPFRK